MLFHKATENDVFVAEFLELAHGIVWFVAIVSDDVKSGCFVRKSSCDAVFRDFIEWNVDGAGYMSVVEFILRATVDQHGIVRGVSFIDRLIDG